jgi:prepilin-type N-terminal cleavage/methylation domain-containing protein
MSTNPSVRGRPRRSRAGFTLAEVLMVTVVVGVGVVGASWLMAMAAQTQSVQAANSTDTLNVAREIRELAGALSRVPSGSGAVTAFADVAALDSLDGAEFSPPILSDGSSSADYTGWTQRIDLSLRDATAPDTVIDAGVPEVVQGSGHVFLLEVEILDDNDALLDTHCWWITP